MPPELLHLMDYIHVEALTAPVRACALLLAATCLYLVLRPLIPFLVRRVFLLQAFVSERSWQRIISLLVMVLSVLISITVLTLLNMESQPPLIPAPSPQVPRAHSRPMASITTE